MAGAAGVNISLTTFLNFRKAHKSAKLLLKSDKGDLSVTLEVNIGQYVDSERKSEVGRGYQGLQRRQASPSQLRRRARRAADQAVQQRAADYAAAAQASHLPTEAAEQVVAETNVAATEREVSAAKTASSKEATDQARLG